MKWNKIINILQELTIPTIIIIILGLNGMNKF